MATEIKSKIEELSPSFKEALDNKNDFRKGPNNEYNVGTKFTTTEGGGKGINGAGYTHIIPSEKAVAYKDAKIAHLINVDAEAGNEADRKTRETLKNISVYSKAHPYPYENIGGGGDTVKINLEPTNKKNRR
jgi:hypothetical protein